MATCKDCLHFTPCGHINQTFDICGQFKNKADYVEVKHGEWIEDKTHISKRKKKYVCSNCLHYITIKTTTGINSRRYCYECGATMDGRRDT